MRVGDLVRFAKQHREKPGLDYCKDWVGIVVSILDPDIEGERWTHILWKHGKVSKYPLTFTGRHSYCPFEVIK